MAKSKKKASKKNTVRLNKFIAECGVASRRKADEMILEGTVSINGKRIYEMGTQVNPLKDTVKVGRKIIKPETTKVYYMFHKPVGILTTLADPEDRPCLKEFVADIQERVFPVGRLDWDSEGLILLTNDGEFSQEIMHPSKGIPKTYIAKLDGFISEAKIIKLKKGVTIPGGRVSALHVEKIKRGADKYDWIKIIISEGKNRQIRHMLNKVGMDVKKLQRVAIGQLTLGKLKRGAYVKLSYAKLLKIFKINESNFNPETGPK